MHEQVTMSFVATRELKQLLETWATQEDRTISATLRQILTQEAKRRFAIAVRDQDDFEQSIIK